MTAAITVRVELEDKIAFEQFCKSVGMTPSTAFNMFLKATLSEGKIPFPIEMDPFYSEANMARLRKNAAEMDATGNSAHEIPLS